MLVSKRILSGSLFLALLALCACSDGGDNATKRDENPAVADADDTLWLTRSAPIAAGDECAHGGERTEVGVDRDESGELDSDEVQSAHVVCWDAPQGANTDERDGGTAQADPGDSPDVIAAVCAAVSANAPDGPEDLSLAMDGPGYFVFQSRAGAEAGRFYARDASVFVSEGGALRDGRGLVLLGYPATAEGEFDRSQLSSFALRVQALSATATSQLKLSVNLNATDGIASAWDAALPASTSNFSTSATLFDSLGSSHAVTVYFAKTDDTVWGYHVLIDDGAGLAYGTPGVPSELCTGSVSFQSNGALAAVHDEPCTVDFKGATPGQAIHVDLGKSVAEGFPGFDGSTSFASPSAVNASSQNGYAAGSIVSISADELGVISALFTNGQRRALGALALARFPIDDGLAPLCGSLWTDAHDPSNAVYGQAGTVGFGLLVNAQTE